MKISSIYIVDKTIIAMLKKDKLHLKESIRNFLIASYDTITESEIKNGTVRGEIDQAIRGEFGNMEMLSNSNRGIIYQKSPGVIFKVGHDQDEYENAVSFLKRPHKNFVTYYSAEPWRVMGDKKLYVFTMERVNELSENQWDIVDLIQNSLGLQEYMLDDTKRYMFMKELEQNPEWYENFATYKEVRAWVFQLYNMYKEADRREITLLDLRAQNLGVNSKGVPVHFDMGEG